MSLKAFHIVFVIVSIAMCVFVGVWGVREYLRTENVTHLAVGVVTLVLGIVLVWYFRWFLRKIKTISVP